MKRWPLILRWLRGLRRARGGMATLEFAMISVPFFALGLGTMEFGRLMWTREALEATAIAGARCMGVLQGACASAGVYSSGNTTTYITTVAGGWKVTLPSSDVTLSRAATCSGSASSAFSQVTINYSFQTVLPSLLTSLASGTSLSVSACFPNQS